MDRKKQRTFFIALASVLLVLSLTSGVAFAYFVKNLQEKVNNFDFSNVKLAIVEENWNSLSPEDKIVYPKREIAKDPKVVNMGGSSMYVYLEVKIPKAEIMTVDDDENLVDAANQVLFNYTVNEGWELLQGYGEETVTEKTLIYAYTKQPLAPNESTETLFDRVRFVNMLAGQLPMNMELEMPMYAYGIQSDYVNDTQEVSMLEKMTEAFEKYQAEAE